METNKTQAPEKALSEIKRWGKERSFESLDATRNGYVACVTEELGEWLTAWDDDDEPEKVDALADIMVFSATELFKMGYDAEKVLLETAKEINSRTGAWSEVDQKWRKFRTPEAKALWYKADYTDCKI